VVSKLSDAEDSFPVAPLNPEFDNHHEDETLQRCAPPVRIEPLKSSCEDDEFSCAPL
jgi:hypothetical protein